MNEVISVVTVCLNSSHNIVKTIDSVLEQNSDNIEYIICDGGSTDKTEEIIKWKINSYSGKKKIVFVQQTDDGVYDAMNKATAHITGNWLIYLNAGDVFASNDVVYEFNNYDKNGYDVVYGNTYIPSKGVWENTRIKNIKYEAIFCHQSVFIRTNLQKKYGFDLKYMYASDYDLFLKLYMLNYKFLHIKKVISIYDEMGISAQNAKYVEEEYKEIHKSNGNYILCVVYANIQKVKRIIKRR